MPKDRIDEILEKLKLLKSYVELLKRYRGVREDELEKDLEKRGVVERYLQLSIEIVLDIADLIIAEYRLPVAKTYKEAIETLGTNKIVDQKFSQKISPMAGLRNVLVHDYVKVDYRMIANFLKENLNDFEEFAKQIAGYFSN